MTDPVYRPKIVDALPPGEELNFEPVEEMSCMGNDDEAVFCITDNHDGTATLHIDASIEPEGGTRNLTVPVGHGTEMAVGTDALYIETWFKDKKFYEIDRATFLVNSVEQFGDGSWMDIKTIRVPYDLDIGEDDGCNGTDWFSSNAPFVPLFVSSGALFIGDEYVVAPGMVLEKWCGDSYGVHRKAKDGAGRILSCALDNAADFATEMRIRSALQMLDKTESTFEPEEGPVAFAYTDIDVTIGSTRLVIRSGPYGADGTIRSMNISLHPLFFLPGPALNINKMGVAYSLGRIDDNKRLIERIGGQNGINVMGTFIKTLRKALRTNLNNRDRGTIEQLLNILGDQRSLTPKWMWK